VTYLRPDPGLGILLFVGVFPSILFWSSILGKEPIVLLGTALYVQGVLGWYARRRGGYLLLMFVGIGMASFIRIWNGPILIFPVLVLFAMGIQERFKRIALLVMGLIGFGLAVRRFAAMLQMETIGDLLASADSWSQAWAIGGSAQQLDLDFTNPVSILLFIPVGIFTALFRPFPGEIMNPFGFLAGLENLFLIGLLLLAAKRARWSDLRHPLAVWALLLVLSWGSAYSIVSYQNLGTAARFKLQIMPVLLGLLVYLGRIRRALPVGGGARSTG
jgi:hypothetical protein